MDIFCPKCKREATELIACEECGDIGCLKCMRKSGNIWKCYKCEKPAEYPFQEQPSMAQQEEENIFTKMFG